MGKTFQPTEQQHEGQEHQFLDYRQAEINFIYSFTWNSAATNWQELSDGLTVLKGKGWRIRPLHERAESRLGAQLTYNYQPSLVFKTKVLERTAQVMSGGTLLLPLRRDARGKGINFDRIPIDLGYTIRLFDNGAATCTFSVRLKEKAVSFRNIHAVLHLASNVDRENEPDVASVALDTPLTHALLQLQRSSGSATAGDRSLLPVHREHYTLHDLLCRLFRLEEPLHWIPKRFRDLWDESDVVDIQPQQHFQSPFIFTIAEVERNSFLRFRKQPSMDSNREVASILCKLTLDNRFIVRDYLHLSDNYIRDMLPYDAARGGLKNLCLDRRLFFTLSRRGAIALTANLDDIPSYFVVPSLLNLCEILRARWHMSNLTSARLDREISRIGSNPNLEPRDLVENLFRWRLMFAAFLRDPVPFLFDGGSITEIAEIAERELWLTKLRDDTCRKFEMLDRLVQDFLEKKRIEDLIRMRDGG